MERDLERGTHRHRLSCAFAVAGLALVLGGCGSSGHKVSTHDPKIQQTVEGKIKQFISQKAISLGSSVVGGQPLDVSWEAIIDPDTGKYNIHSV